MPGMLDWKIKISADIKDLQNKMHKVEGELGEFEGKDHKVKLDLDTKTLESALKKLDSMLDSLGKGTGDFKQFETLSKDLAKVTSELSGFTKAFGKIDNSGTKSLLDMVQNIDKSLNNLSSHITDEFLNKITSSVGTVKQKFADIGDGSEFEPLLQMINKIDSSINNLAKETSKIKLNMNLDFGTEMSEKMNQQVSKAVSRQAQAYKNLFETMKGSGKTTEEMIKFSLPENASNSEIVGAYKGVIERAEKQYGKSTYSLRLGSKYNDAKNEIKNANAALRRAEIKRTNSNGVSDLLGGNFGDVINELSKIATKLDEISSSASGLKSAFETGFNVSASVEEIAQLTNKVKKLEDELQKVKSVSSGTVSTDVTLGNESNISLGDSSATSAIEQQKKDTSDIIKLTDNYGRELDEANSKLLKGTALLDEQGKLIRLYHGSDTEFDKFDLSRSNNQIYGKGAYLIESEKGAEGYGSVVTQWYANVRKVMNEEGQLTLEEAQKLYNEFGRQLLNIFGKQMDFDEFFDAYIKFNPEETTVVEKMKSLANYLGKDIGDLFQAIGYDAIKMDRSNGSFYTIFDPDRLIRFKEAAVETTSAVEKLGASASQNPTKDAFPDKDVSTSVESATNSIKEENNVLEQNTQKVKENTQAKEQNTNVNLNKYDKRLDSYNGKVDKYQATIDRFNDGGWTSDTYLKNVQAVRDAIKQYATLLDNIKTNQNGIASDKDIQNLDKYEKKIKDTIATVTNMSAAEKGYNFVSGQKELDKIHKILDENTRMSSSAKAKIKSYYKEIESGNPSMSLDKIHGEIMKIVNAEKEAGRAGKSMWSAIKEKAWYGAASAIGTYFGVNDIFRYGKEIADIVIQLDTATTELRKVSDATDQRLVTNFKNSAKTAKQLGSTISDVISATADWSRMGYDIDQAEELARVSTLYKNVGDGIDIETANNSLISTLQGFQLDASQAESIIDKFNEVANNYAIDSAGIGEALQRSAASFNAANTDLSKSIALITATNEVVQDPDSVGTLWKTMSARIRGAETELSELNEETDEYTKTTSKLRDLIKNLTGFDIMADEDTFKDIYDIILGIGKEWNNLTDAEQSSLGEALAGKRNANALYAVLGNIDTLQSAYKTAENSAGSAQREQENYQKSIQYSIDQTKAKLEELSADFLSSDFLKGAIDAGGKLIDILDNIVKSGNAIPAVATAIAAAFSFKNVGFE